MFTNKQFIELKSLYYFNILQLVVNLLIIEKICGVRVRSLNHLSLKTNLHHPEIPLIFSRFKAYVIKFT